MWTNHLQIAPPDDVLCVNSLGVCRLCLLKGCTSMESIFRSSQPSNIADKIAKVTRLTLAEGDGLPTMVCQQCLFQLDVADTFIQRCEQSARSFKRLSIQEEIEDGTSSVETLNSTSSCTTGVVVSPLEAIGTIDQYATSAVVKDPDYEMAQSNEYPIKLEFTDYFLDYDVQAYGGFTADDVTFQEDSSGENDVGDKISIKIEDIGSVEIASPRTEERFDGVSSGSNANVDTESNVDQSMSVIEKYKCTVCGLEFRTWRSLHCHSISHTRKQRKSRGKSLTSVKNRKKLAERSQKPIAVPGVLQEKVNVNVLTSSDVQDISESPMSLSNNGQNKDISPASEMEIVKLQSLKKRSKCVLDSTSPERLVLDGMSHKTKCKSESLFQKTSSLDRSVTRVSIRKQHAQNNINISPQANKSQSKDDNLDNSIDSITSDGFESTKQPKINQILSVTKKFRCSICLSAFPTRLKKTLHICIGKTAREKILQRRLLNQTSKKIGPQLLTLTELDGSSSKFCGISENLSDVSREPVQVLSALSVLTCSEKIPPTYLQEKNSEMSSVTTKLEEATKKDLPSVVEAKQSESFKCDVCSLEFCFSFQLERHMRKAKGHRKKYVKKHYRNDASGNKSAQMLQNGPNGENHPLEDNVCDVSVAKLESLSTNNGSLLEENSKDVPDRAFTLQPLATINHKASIFSAINSETNAVSQGQTSPSELKCDSCMSNFLCSLSLSQHICHSSKGVQDSRLRRAQKRKKANKQLLPTHANRTSHIFRAKARGFNVLATGKKQRASTAQERREDISDLSGETGLSVTLPSEPINRLIDKKPTKHHMNHEPIDHGNQSKAAHKAPSKMLPFDEKSLDKLELPKLQSFSEDRRNVLNRELMVQLDRLKVIAEKEKEVTSDFMQQTQSKNSDPPTGNISMNNNINESDKKSAKYKKTLLLMPSVFDKALTIDKNHAEERSLQHKPRKYVCKHCFEGFISPLGLGRHIKIHKKKHVKKS